MERRRVCVRAYDYVASLVRNLAASLPSCPMSAAQRFLGLIAAVLTLSTSAEVAQPPVRSTRGVQHKDPIISDDFVVGCIMVMFLLLFCFGARAYSSLHSTPCPIGDHQPPPLSKNGRASTLLTLVRLCAPCTGKQ